MKGLYSEALARLKPIVCEAFVGARSVAVSAAGSAEASPRPHENGIRHLLAAGLRRDDAAGGYPDQCCTRQGPITEYLERDRTLFNVVDRHPLQKLARQDTCKS